MQAFYTVLDTNSVEEVLFHSLLLQGLRAGAQESKGQVLKSGLDSNGLKGPGGTRSFIFGRVISSGVEENLG